MELELLDTILPTLKQNDSVITGPGDDCAVVAFGNRKLLLAVDQVTENIHFTGDTAPERAGAKLVKRNLSDIAAMGGEPLWMLLAVSNGNRDIEWVKIGHFAGEKPVQSLSNNIIELIAYDRMVRFEKEASDFVKTLTFPCTIGTICDKLCDFVVIDRVAGDEIADVMNWQIDDNTGWESFNSCRDILASIAEATGCYARMTNNGELQFIWFADHKSEQTLTLNNCFSGNVIKLEKSYSKKWGTLETTKWKDVETIKYSEYDNNNNPFVYSYVRALWKEADGSTTEVVQPDYDPYYNHRLWANAENFMWESVESMKYKDFETADDLIGNTYTIDDNPFIKHDTTASIKTHLQDILDNLYVFHLYYVASVQMVGNWLIEPGDVVLLEIADNVFVEYPIFTRILSWNGSCECSYDTTGTLAG